MNTETQYSISETVENWFSSMGVEALRVAVQRNEVTGDLICCWGEMKASCWDDVWDAMDFALKFHQDIALTDSRFDGMRLKFEGDTKFTIEI